MLHSFDLSFFDFALDFLGISDEILTKLIVQQKKPITLNLATDNLEAMAYIAAILSRFPVELVREHLGAFVTVESLRLLKDYNTPFKEDILFDHLVSTSSLEAVELMHELFPESIRRVEHHVSLAVHSGRLRTLRYLRKTFKIRLSENMLVDALNEFSFAVANYIVFEGRASFLDFADRSIERWSYLKNVPTAPGMALLETFAWYNYKQLNQFLNSMIKDLGKSSGKS